MSTKTIMMYAIGFVEKDQRMIRNVLLLASTRQASYVLATSGQEPADLVLVNADDPVAVASWNEYRKTLPQIRVIFAAANPLFQSEHVCIKRPLIASQLHGVLALGEQRQPRASRSQQYEILGKSFLFRNLAAHHLDRIIELSRVIMLPADQVVFERGSTGEEMFVVLKGRLKVSVTNPEGTEIVLGAVGEGEILGEIAMLDGRGRSATAITLIPCELLVIQRKDFMPLLEQDSKAAIDLISVLALRLRLNTEQLANQLDENECPD